MNSSDIANGFRRLRRRPISTAFYGLAAAAVILVGVWLKAFLSEKGKQAASNQQRPLIDPQRRDVPHREREDDIDEILRRGDQARIKQAAEIADFRTALIYLSLYQEKYGNDDFVKELRPELAPRVRPTTFPLQDTPKLTCSGTPKGGDIELQGTKHYFTVSVDSPLAKIEVFLDGERVKSQELYCVPNTQQESENVLFCESTDAFALLMNIGMIQGRLSVDLFENINSDADQEGYAYLGYLDCTEQP